MVRKIVSVGLLLGVSSCTLILGRYDDSGTGGGATASSGATASGTGGATASASGTGGTMTSTSGTGGATSSAAGTGGATSSTSSSASGTGGGCVTAADCPVILGKCVVPVCAPSHVCTVSLPPAKTPCSDSGGTVCNGMGACVPCSSDADCGSLAPVCNMGACVACTATNAAACTGATPTCYLPTHTCVASTCANDNDCGPGRSCISNHCYGPGDLVSQQGNGPSVTLPDCASSLVSLADGTCNAIYAGTHWCTAADANGAGTYHLAACATMSTFQFDGAVTCSGGAWITDHVTGCVGGVVSYSAQYFGAMGNLHPVDCCR